VPPPQGEQPRRVGLLRREAGGAIAALQRSMGTACAHPESQADSRTAASCRAPHSAIARTERWLARMAATAGARTAAKG
jgi:hypothetical protein